MVSTSNILYRSGYRGCYYSDGQVKTGCLAHTHTHTHAGEMNFAACCSVSDLSPCSGQSPAAGSNTSRADITSQICFTKTLQGKSK